VTGGPVREAESGLLARLWPVVDPARDVLPAEELIDAVLVALEDAFELPAAALELLDGERYGPGPDDPVWDVGPRLVVPVHIATEELGRLEIAVPGGAVSPDEQLAYRLAATRLGRAVARRRYEATQAQAQERLRADAIAVERLYRAAGALMAERELGQVVQYVTEEATALVRAQFGAFFYNVLDDRGASYMLYSIAGVPRSEFDRFPMPRKTQVFAPTFAGEAIVRSDDITADPRYGHSPPHHGMPPGHLPVRSYLAVPVLARDGEVLGGLFFGHEDIGVFDADAERLVTGLAALAALAIENARLHDTAQRELDASRRAFRERDQVARVLQESLLPPDLPRPDGLDVAARYVAGEGIAGGDFYDLFPVADGEWVAAIGDVEGKGAHAAARTSLVRHAVRLGAFQSSGPAEILEIVNRAVLQDGDASDHRFSTLLVARVRRGDGGATVAIGSGGHPPALVLRAGGAVERVDCAGTLLGVVADFEASETVVALGRGDAIVLYTDGLTEARRGGALLGEERVREILGGLAGSDADTVAAALERAPAQWSEGPRRDDLAVLVLRVA
jgi:serine phosphatase RsbU (regulator of sigma subunit)